MRQQVVLENFGDPAAARGRAESEIFNDLAWSEIATMLRLSGRELEIARGIVSDEAESAIAERLGISKHTVHSHLERVYRKTGVNSRLQLVVKVFVTHLRVVRLAGESARMSSSQGTV